MYCLSVYLIQNKSYRPFSNMEVDHWCLSLITVGQKEENPKFVQPDQICTLYPEGGVVWKICY